MAYQTNKQIRVYYCTKQNKQTRLLSTSAAPKIFTRFIKNLCNCGILYVENYIIDTFSNMVRSSLLSRIVFKRSALTVEAALI